VLRIASEPGESMSTPPDEPSQGPRWVVVEPHGEDAGEPCPDCGQPIRRVWGYVTDHSQTISSYFVTWVPGHPRHAIGHELVFGRWDEQATGQNRVAISLDMLNINGDNAIKFVDAQGRIQHDPRLFSKALTFQEAIDSPLAADILFLANSVYRTEPRLEEVRKWGLAG
jgi:hypothetical protein